MAHSGNYPAHWEADVVLRDGTTMHIRPIRAEDAEALQRFHMSQSERSTYLRFFAPMERLSDTMLTRFTQVDHRDQVALVLVDRTQIIAVGRFERLGETDAEVAFNVADSAQGKGLGSVLLEHLAAAGRELGVRRFVADVLPQNSKMLRVFADTGYEVQSQMDDGILAVSFSIASTDRSLAVLAEREQRTEALSMAALMRPAGVVLVCDGVEGEAFGRFLLGSLTQQGAPEVQVVGLSGVPEALDSVDQVRPGADLALIAAEPEQVLAMLGPLADAGVRGVVIYTGGFSVDPAAGRTSQRSLLRQVRRHGLRLVGPRSYGLIAGGDARDETNDDAADRAHRNHDDGAPWRVEASLYPNPPRAGSVGLFGQSAASGRALLSGAAARDLGVSSFLSAGHRMDVSGNDVMQRWVDDGTTTVACLRLESIGNPRKFSRVARRLSVEGPVITTIAGTTGQLNPPGHAVATTSLPRRALDELMRQAGVLATDTVDESLDLALLLSEQPFPAGTRVLVLTNSGAQAAMVTELLRGSGVGLSGQAHTLSPTAGAQAYAEQVHSIITRGDWDMALVGYVPLLTDDGVGVAEQVAHLSAASGRTTVAVIDGMRGLDPNLRAVGTHGPVRVPGFATLRTATTALARAVRYVQWRDADHGTRVDPEGIDRIGAKALVQAELTGVPAGSTRRLAYEQATDLLGRYGITLWEQRTVRTLTETLAAADQVGWPVALKTSDELLRHRLDLGGVRLDLGTPAELTEAYHSVQDRVRAVLGHETSLELQAMAPTGTATVIEAVEDGMYGPIISFGLAGDASELLGDVSYRVPPLTDVDVAYMIRSLGASGRLLGRRGLPALDVTGLEDVLARVSVLKEELAEVSSVVLHPVLVTETEVAVLGARLDIAPPARGDAARRVLPT